MLRDRYAAVDLFALVPQPGLRFGPELADLDRLLEDEALFRAVKADLARRHRQTPTRGRRSTPVEVVRRMLVVRRLSGRSYEATEHVVGDSLVLGQVGRLALEPAPDATTLLRRAACVGPATVERLNERVGALARGLKVTRGRKLRTDPTVVETNVHPPSDSTPPACRPAWSTTGACSAARPGSWRGTAGPTAPRTRGWPPRWAWPGSACPGRGTAPPPGSPTSASAGGAGSRAPSASSSAAATWAGAATRARPASRAGSAGG
jgi:hypothetical protein